MARANGTITRLAAQLDRLAAAHRRQRRIGQSRQQLQPPADPAHVATAPSRHFVPRQSVLGHQCAQQQRFLDAGERTIPRPRQHPQQRRGQVAGPLLDANGVAAETTQCADPAIAVDQHQCLHAATLAILALGGRHHDARHDLAAPLDRLRQPRHRPRFHQPAVGEAQLQAVQVQFDAITRHGATASRAARPSL